MARQLRLDEPGLTHHITSRGNDRQVIFRDDTDCLQFLVLLAEAVRRYNLVLLGWVLIRACGAYAFQLDLDRPG